MGQFSWLDCVTGEQILDNVARDVYVLIPKEFGGGRILEVMYDGYGHFGGQDIYELVAIWNRQYLSENPKHVFPRALKRLQWVQDYKKSHPDYSEEVEVYAKEKAWYAAYEDLNIPEEGIEYVSGYVLRHIGIEIACYDEDNEALRYPIKITHDVNAVYEDCGPSKSDPNQGWPMNYDEDEEDGEEW